MNKLNKKIDNNKGLLNEQTFGVFLMDTKNYATPKIVECGDFVTTCGNRAAFDYAFDLWAGGQHYFNFRRVNKYDTNTFDLKNGRKIVVVNYDRKNRSITPEEAEGAAVLLVAGLVGLGIGSLIAKAIKE